MDEIKKHDLSTIVVFIMSIVTLIVGVLGLFILTNCKEELSSPRSYLWNFIIPSSIIFLSISSLVIGFGYGFYRDKKDKLGLYSFIIGLVSIPLVIIMLFGPFGFTL